MLAYPNSHGWSHRDLLRLSHPKAATPAHNALFQWVVDGELGHLASPELLSGDLRQIRAYEQAKKASRENEIVQLIEENRLTHQLIPSEWKNSAQVWEALLPSMPYADLVRHLGKLTAVGLIQPQSPATALVVARLIDRKRIRNSRIHPIALLEAQLHYEQQPAAVASVIDALEEAFHLAFENVEPIGKRIHLELDASSRYEKVSAALALLFGGKASNSIDAFVIITDNKPPAQLLGRMAAKLVVIALAATDCSISDPDDALQLGVAGFDASVTQVVAEFLKG
jgi:60 kDa SS-A/Ro ribonucleoprotein